jgi:hypothetical protein
MVRSPPIESKSQALPGPPKFGNCTESHLCLRNRSTRGQSGNGNSLWESVYRGKNHEVRSRQVAKIQEGSIVRLGIPIRLRGGEDVKMH